MANLVIPDLANKAVLITGASTGIGAALARAFAAQGAKVGLHYNSSKDAAEALAKEISAAGGTTTLIKADATKSAEMRAAVEATVKAFGRLDGLINNAGGMVARQPYQEYTEDLYDQVMDLNARSVLAASHAAIPHLKAAGGGFIINTTSIAARNGAGGGAGLYGSSKAFDTPFHERYSTEAQLKAMLATVPQGRLGVSEDCVGAFLFLASPSLSGYVIGQTLEVNGGQLMP
jgi:3-oxoacyl-[acyl-carrier protein] reductase